jgi:hypothetical protein
MTKPLVIVHGIEEEHECMLCLKPVPLTLNCTFADGTHASLCRADFFKLARLHARKNRPADDEIMLTPTGIGDNGRDIG